MDVGAGAGQYGAFFGGCSEDEARPRYHGYDGAENVKAIGDVILCSHCASTVFKWYFNQASSKT